MSELPVDTYVAALRFELEGVVRSGDVEAQAAVKAELDRVTGTPVETADAPVVTENRAE